MPAKQLTVRGNGGAPEIEIVIGQAHLGLYRVYLWKDSQSDLVGSGANDDSIDDKFPVASAVGALEGRLLTWQITIQSLTGKPGEIYSATVTITQDGTVLDSYTYRDKLEGAKLIVGGVRFNVV